MATKKVDYYAMIDVRPTAMEQAAVGAESEPIGKEEQQKWR